MVTYIGIDNGITGSIAMLSEGKVIFMPTPTISEQSYTKAKAKITRVDWRMLQVVFASMCSSSGEPAPRVFLERPYVNPKGFKATVSALRSLEATLICIEFAGLSYQYVDSRDWQRVMLPTGCKGRELKDASRDIGCRLFPDHAVTIKKHKDADSLLIAEWARRSGL